MTTTLSIIDMRVGLTEDQLNAAKDAFTQQLINSLQPKD